MKLAAGLLVIGCVLLAGACSTNGPGVEAVREQPSKTVYKSADEDPADAADAPVVVPTRQKVPGE